MSKNRPDPLVMRERSDSIPNQRHRSTQSDAACPTESTTDATTRRENLPASGSHCPVPPAEVVELVLRLLQEELSALESVAGRHFLTIGQFTRRGVAEFLARERQIVSQCRHPIKEDESC